MFHFFVVFISAKTSSAPPGMIHPNLMYTGVQPGILPAAYQVS